jgi:hypothetical protein
MILLPENAPNVVFSGDINSDGVMDPGESWNWDVTISGVTTATTFTATGHGWDPLGNNITWPDYPEQGKFTVSIPVPALSNIGLGLMIAGLAGAMLFLARRKAKKSQIG